MLLKKENVLFAQIGSSNNKKRGEKEMSKAERIREMQEEINSLKYQLTQANNRITQYVNRDKPMAMDFLKSKEAKKK